MTKNAAIVGLGTWLPDRVRTNDEWPPSFGQRADDGDRTFNDIPPSEDPIAAGILARDLAKEANDPFLGAVRRRVAADSMTAVDSEIHAARSALAEAGLSGSDVDVVMSHSIVPDRVGPASAVSVAHAIGAHRAMAFGIEAACASGLIQLGIARAYVESGFANVVLLTQSHLMLRAFPMEHPAAPGLGDAASAMVVARGAGLTIRSTFGVTHGEHALSVTWIRGHDDVTDSSWWKAGPEFRMGTRALAGAKLLMRETVSYGAATVREAADRASLDAERIAVLASVQPRGFLPGAIAERLGLPRERAVTTYDELAHIGVCGPVFNLLSARKQGLLPPGAIAALYAQGAGFTRSAAMLEMVPTSGAT
jgi:3-oxoacyl-[acyl-carrier-protein] synthase-3